MTFAFKLAKRLAQNFGLAGAAATIVSCAGEPTDALDSPPPVTTVSVSPPTASVAVDDTIRLFATLRDSLGGELDGRSVTWTSDDVAIATVTAAGVVRGAAVGSTTIRAASEGRWSAATVTVTGGGAGGSTGPRPGYYVSPAGASSATGSFEQPWDLATALSGAGGRVQPGDTIWMRGGTYQGNFRTTVKGTAAAPVVVRAYPGERAIVDGATGSATASTWYVGGPYTVFWGFEIINSNPTRVFSTVGDRQNVVANYASHTKYINLVVHDGGVAFYNEANYVDVEIMGCIIYNIGWQGSDRGHGHALYLKSNTGPVLARDNIMFNQFGYGVHLYSNPGSGQLNNIRLEGNVAFNNGTLSTNSTASNMLIGGDDYSTGNVLVGNMTYSSPGVANRNVHVGYGSLPNGTVELRDNYFIGGSTVLEVGYWSSFTATGNWLSGTNVVVKLNDPALSLSLFSGQTASVMPTATKVVVRPNPYERGRANVVVYNWGGDGEVSVNLDGIVPAGAAFEIRNVQDLFGTPVVTGTYHGGSVPLPISAVPAPVPIGMSSSRAPATGTAFNTYIVTLREE